MLLDELDKKVDNLLQHHKQLKQHCQELLAENSELREKLSLMQEKQSLAANQVTDLIAQLKTMPSKELHYEE